jgi:hypothetical protein
VGCYLDGWSVRLWVGMLVDKLIVRLKFGSSVGWFIGFLTISVKYAASIEAIL